MAMAIMKYEPTDSCDQSNQEGLDRERVGVVVVVHMHARGVLAFQVLLLKATPRWNTVAAERGPANTIMAMIK